MSTTGSTHGSKKKEEKWCNDDRRLTHGPSCEEGKRAIKWTRCRAGRSLQMPVGSSSMRSRTISAILRTLMTPEPIREWSLTSLKEKLIKIDAKVVSHGRYITFQMAEVAIPRDLFAEILRLIAELRPRDPAPA
jgi:hypothetical protein